MLFFLFSLIIQSMPSQGVVCRHKGVNTVKENLFDVGRGDRDALQIPRGTLVRSRVCVAPIVDKGARTGDGHKQQVQQIPAAVGRVGCRKNAESSGICDGCTHERKTHRRVARRCGIRILQQKTAVGINPRLIIKIVGVL